MQLMLLTMIRPILTPLLLKTRLILSVPILLTIRLFLLQQNTIYIIEWNILTMNSSPISITIILDTTASLFSLTVRIITLAVIRFSIDYINEEKFLQRFTLLVALFVASINFLIFTPNLITLLIGWDGLGLTSFLLVIFYQNPRSLGAGLLTALTNRLGDALIIVAIALTITNGNWNFIHIWDNRINIYIRLLIIIASITKRAQIPFSSWLPAAIAAPTPVSALVHSSTLVTAGIYLLIRFNPIIQEFSLTQNILLILSTSTTLIAGLAAITETDIKKIIALSTLSQLGIIIIRLALNAPLFTFFHLITHAIFKALLFISAGTLIHLHNNNQDLRIFGNLSTKTPISALAMLVSSAALIGFPYLAGFYSKDLIIELTSSSTFHFLIFCLTLISTLLTSIYSIRLIYFTTLIPQIRLPHTAPLNNLNVNSTKAITILITIAIILGAILNWILVFPSFSPPVPVSTKIIPLILLTLAVFSVPSLIIKIITPKISYIPHIINFFSSIWFLTPNTTYWIPFYISSTRTHFAHSIDHGWNELFGAQGTTIFINSIYCNMLKWHHLPFPQALKVRITLAFLSAAIII